MKKLFSLSLALLLLTLQNVFGVTVVSSLVTNGTASIVGDGVYIASVQVANATGVTAYVSLFDAPSTSLTYTRAAFTYPSSYTTNIVTTYTNINGVSTSVTNSAVYTYTATAAAATNSYRLINTITVPANSTVTWTPVNGYYTVYGILATNNAVTTATTTYAPLQ